MARAGITAATDARADIAACDIDSTSIDVDCAAVFNCPVGADTCPSAPGIALRNKTACIAIDSQC